MQPVLDDQPRPGIWIVPIEDGMRLVIRFGNPIGSDDYDRDQVVEIRFPGESEGRRDIYPYICELTVYAPPENVTHDLRWNRLVIRNKLQ